MKKLFITGLVLLSIVTLAGCNTGNNSDASSSSTVTQKNNKVSKTKASFKTDKLVVTNGTVAITDTKVMLPNKTTGIKDPTLVVKFNFKNTGKKSTTPLTVFLGCFEATQKINGKTIKLAVAAAPAGKNYAKLNDNGMATIKPEKSTSSIISYVIQDKTKAIKLIATNGLEGQNLGEKTVTVN